MKLIAIIGTTALLAAAPASIGLIGNTSFSEDVPVRVPATATLLDSQGSPTASPSHRSHPRGEAEPADDHGGDRPSGTHGEAEPGDDHGGDRPRDTRTEVGDDHGGHGEAESGDDHSGHGGHGGDDSGGDDSGGDRHGGDGSDDD
jgi:hypothetical protein